MLTMDVEQTAKLSMAMLVKMGQIQHKTLAYLSVEMAMSW